MIETLRFAVQNAPTESEARRVIAQINALTRRYKGQSFGKPTPLAQAVMLDSGYLPRPHLDFLSDRLAAATADVQNGQTRFLTVSMPPRMGKSQLTSIYLPLWLLSRHPDWPLGLISHSGHLAATWGRQVRRMIEERGTDLGVQIAKDAGAVASWETTEGGKVISRSMPGQSITGEGFKALLIDDPVKDFAAAHSAVQRDAVWDWWKANAITRLNRPALVVVVGTRWHEDDMIGRLLSPEYEGNPDDWEQIVFPALAEGDDVLGRTEGGPLLSPIAPDEDDALALQRWAEIKEAVGSYTWAALYQQRPAPAEGNIFNTGWWRYWTTDPGREDAVYLDPTTDLTSARWLDSWDLSFKGADSSDFVVGQRWARRGGDRFLIAQQRGRWSFTQTLTALRAWIDGGPGARHVHERLVEDAANGPAIIDTLKAEVAGLLPVKARVGKEARARAVTPEVESGNVYLPHPGDPGNEWVNDLLSELSNFPGDVHDDQVDALTQGLLALRDHGKGWLYVPGRNSGAAQRNSPKNTSALTRPTGTIRR